MNNLELARINPSEVQLTVNEVVKARPPKDKNSFPQVLEVIIDRKTNLIKHELIEILYIKLKYTNTQAKQEYNWDITKTLVSFKNFLSRLGYYITKKKLTTFPLAQVTKIQKKSYLELKKSYTNEVFNLLNSILSFDFEFDREAVFINEYFEISANSFVSYNNGIKPKEGYILKRTEYNLCQTTCIDLCKCIKCCCCASYEKDWFLLKEDMICYLDSSTSGIGKNTFWFDKNSRMEVDGSYITLRNSGKKIKLKFELSFERDIWYSEINWRMRKYIENIKPNIYSSFVNEKTNCKARWFVDGEDYFADLHDRLLKAKETVFITDWWMSPEIWLKRPVNANIYTALQFGQPLEVEEKDQDKLSRLCDILNFIAGKGVRVYILVFCEFSLALTLNSKHTKTMLVNLHENIEVVRHPKKSFDLLWSHHEKLVVIDQRYAYVGGLDLCWGRYDNHKHPLTDVKNNDEIYLFPGIDYSNARVADFIDVENYMTEAIERTKPRMPWHDIHSMIEGPAVLDIARHFVERWNFVKAYTNTVGITNIQTQYIKKETLRKKQTNKEDLINKPQQLDSENNEIDLSKIDEENNFDEVQKKPTFKRPAIEKTRTDYFRTQKTIIQDKISLKQKLINKIVNKKKKDNLNHWVNLSTFNVKFNPDEVKMTCQCLRSLSNWSGGLNITENSILQGYYNLIENAEHYIYIENQFFISKSFTEDEYAENGKSVSNLIINEIALKIRDRIVKAHRKGEKFRVIIFIPLLPGFAGDIEFSSTLQVICKYTYKSLSRNKGLSLIERLQSLLDLFNPDVYKKYISVFSLRTHDMLNGVPVTELIYIHSKLMIVDDRFVIMGSANINDRSMTGDRDSEFAVIYKENTVLPSIMDGKPYKASGFAKSLRVSIWQEHFGIENSDIGILNDPLSDDLYKLMNQRAETNSSIYFDLFKCYPDDAFKTFRDIPKIPEKTGEELEKFIEEYNEKKKGIVGHAVKFPLYFLKDEILERSFYSAEMLVPIKNFV